MRTLLEEARLFAGEKRALQAEAAQRVAFRLIAGIDMERAVAAGPDEKQALARRIERLLERERMRGLNRHWSYDLNRHIALKQALDRLRDDGGEKQRAGAAHGGNRPGTMRRRCRRVRQDQARLA